MKIRTTRRGTSLMEVLVASSLTVTVLAASVGLFLTGMVGWARGQGKIDADGGAQRAIREVSQTLREAMHVIPDPDGYGLTYRLPATDGAGNYIVPVPQGGDGIDRRMAVVNGNLVLSGGAPDRIICKGVVFQDPQSVNGTGTYRVFTPGAGTVHYLDVMIVSQRSADAAKTATSRSRERIYLRNSPEIFR